MPTNFEGVLNVSKVTGLPQAVKQIDTALKGVKGVIDIKVNDAAIKKLGSLNPQLTTLKNSLDAITGSAGNASAAMQKFGNTLRGIGSVSQSIKQTATSLNSVSSSSNKANSGVTSLTKSTRDASQAFTRMERTGVSSFNNISSSVKGVANNIAKANTEFFEFGKQTALATRRFVAFTVGAGVIFGTIGAMSKATDAAIEFEKELIKVGQVTGRSGASLAQIEKTVRSLSREFGVSSKELITAAQTLAQAGFSARDTETALRALAKTDLSPTFDSIEQTTDGLIALSAQFKISAKDFEKVLGSLNRVAADFAAESDDFIVAIQKFGGVFATASGDVKENGIDRLNELIAVFTSVRATTRESADTVSTGLRTIFSRLQRPETLAFLRKFNIELQEIGENGERLFVGPQEAVLRIGAALEGVNTKSQTFAEITKEIAGVRQNAKIIPLLTEIRTNLLAKQKAQEGSNSLDEDTVAAQRTLSNQLTKTKEAFLELSAEILKPGIFRSFIEGSLQLTSVLADLVKGLKDFFPLIAAVGAFGLSKKAPAFLQGFQQQITKFNTDDFGNKLQGQNRPKSFTPGGLGGFLSARNILGGATTPKQKEQVEKSVNVASSNVTALNVNTTALNRLTTLLSGIKGGSGAAATGVAATGVQPVVSVTGSATQSSAVSGRFAILAAQRRAQLNSPESIGIRNRNISNQQAALLGIPPNNKEFGRLPKSSILSKERRQQLIRQELDNRRLRQNVESNVISALRRDQGGSTGLRQEAINAILKSPGAFPTAVGGPISSKEFQALQQPGGVTGPRQLSSSQLIGKSTFAAQKQATQQLPIVPLSVDSVFSQIRQNLSSQKSIEARINRLQRAGGEGSLLERQTSRLNAVAEAKQLRELRRLERQSLTPEDKAFRRQLLTSSTTPTENKPSFLSSLRQGRFREGLNNNRFGLGIGASLVGSFISSQAQKQSSGGSAFALGGIGGGLAGAGLGLTLFGPAGAAVGLLVGSAQGAATALNDFNERIAKSKLDESFKNLSDAFDKFSGKNLDEIGDKLAKSVEDIKFADLTEQKRLGFGPILGQVAGFNSRLIGQGGQSDNLTRAIGNDIGGAVSAFFNDAFAGNLTFGFDKDLSKRSGGIAGFADNLVTTRGKLLQSQFGDTGKVTEELIKKAFKEGKSIEDVKGAEEFETIGEIFANIDPSKAKEIARIELSRQKQSEKDIQIGKIRTQVEDEILKKLFKLIQAEKLTGEAFDSLSEHLNNLGERLSLTSAVAEKAFQISKDSTRQNANLLSVLGTPQIGQQAKSADIFGNIRGNDPKVISSRLGRLKQFIGEGGRGIIEPIEEQLNLVQELEKRFKIASGKALSNAGKGNAESPTDIFTRQAEEAFKGNENADALRIGFKKLIEQAFSKGQGVEDVRAFIESNPINKLSQGLDLEKTLVSIAKPLDEAGQNLIDSLDEITKRNLEQSDLLNRAFEKRLDAEVDSIERFGGRASISQRLAGFTGVVTGLAGTTNVREIQKKLGGALEDRKLSALGIEESLPGGSNPSIERLIQFSNELANTNTEIAKYKQALSILASDTKRASAIQNELNQIQKRREAGGSLIDRLLTGGPKEFLKLRRETDIVEAIRTGDSASLSKFRPDEIPGAVKTFTDLLNSTGLTKQAGALEAQKNSIFAEAFGLKGGGGPFGKIIDATVTGFGGTAEEKRLDADIKAADDASSEAAKILAGLIVTTSTTFKSNAEDALNQVVVQLRRIPLILKENLDEIAKLSVLDDIEAFKKKQTQEKFLVPQRFQPQINKNSGGMIPGYGNTDTVPAMLTRGEYVVNARATRDNLGLLEAINGYAEGGFVQRSAYDFSRTGAGAGRSAREKTFEERFPELSAARKASPEVVARIDEALARKRFTDKTGAVLRPASEDASVDDPRLIAAKGRISAASARSDASLVRRGEIAAERTKIARQGITGLGFNGRGDGATKLVRYNRDPNLGPNAKLGLPENATLEERAEFIKRRRGIGGPGLVAPGLKPVSPTPFKLPARLDDGSPGIPSKETIYDGKRIPNTVEAVKRAERIKAAKERLEAYRADPDRRAIKEGREELNKITFQNSKRGQELAARRAAFQANKAARIAANGRGFAPPVAPPPFPLPAVPAAPVDVKLDVSPSTRLDLLRARQEKERRDREERAEGRRRFEGAAFRIPGEPSPSPILKPKASPEVKAELEALRRSRETGGILRVPPPDAPKESILDKKIALLNLEKNISTRNAAELRGKAADLRAGKFGPATPDEEFNKKHPFLTHGNALNFIRQAKGFNTGGYTGGSSGSSGGGGLGSKLSDSLNKFAQTSSKLCESMDKLANLNIPSTIEFKGMIQPIVVNFTGGGALTAEIKDAVINTVKKLVQEELNNVINTRFNRISGEPSFSE
jgi:TP901 family phage tail tape measure protein